MFNEEWELLTEPQLIEMAPLLYISGMATKDDEFTEKRVDLNEQFDNELAALAQTSVDRSKEVKTPPEKKERLQLSERDKFEKANEHLGLYYSDKIYKSIMKFYDEVVGHLLEEGVYRVQTPFSKTYKIE